MPCVYVRGQVTKGETTNTATCCRWLLQRHKVADELLLPVLRAGARERRVLGGDERKWTISRGRRKGRGIAGGCNPRGRGRRGGPRDRGACTRACTGVRTRILRLGDAPAIDPPRGREHQERSGRREENRRATPRFLDASHGKRKPANVLYVREMRPRASFPSAGISGGSWV